METIEFSDEQTYAGAGGGSNRHVPRLLFQTNDAFVPFAGASVEGVCRVLRDDYRKNGKWSHTRWRLQVADNTRAWTNAGGALRDLANPEDKGCSLVRAETWADVPEELRTVVRAIGPKLAARLDEAEKTV